MLIFSGELDALTADVSITVFDSSTGRETALEEHPKDRPLNIQNCLCWGWGDDPPEWAKTLAAAILRDVLGDDLALELAAEFAGDVLRQLPPAWSLTDDQIEAWAEANHPHLFITGHSPAEHLVPNNGIARPGTGSA